MMKNGSIRNDRQPVSSRSGIERVLINKLQMWARDGWHFRLSSCDSSLEWQENSGKVARGTAMYLEILE